jgi:hypothetical protein
MATVHNGYSPMAEILNNLNLVRSVWQCVSDPDFSLRIKLFHLQMNSSHRMAVPSSISHTGSSLICRPSFRIPMPSDELLQCANLAASTRPFTLFKTVMYGSLRLSAQIENGFGKTADDCIMYKNTKSPDLNIGFIVAVLHFNQSNELQLIVRPVQCTSYVDTVIVHRTAHHCPNIITGYIKALTFEIVHPKRIIQKLTYRPGKPIDAPDIQGSYYFFQFPNLMEST